VSLGQCSLTGPKDENQDSLAACIPIDSALSLKGIALAVADGISTSKVSRIAAETAVTGFIGDYYSTPDSWSVKLSARRVIESLNSWLYAQSQHAQSSDMNQGYVCTLSAMVIKGQSGHIFHVGDSAVLRYREGVLESLTEPHEWVISETERYLGRALGAKGSVEIDYRCVALQEGDIFILATDGVVDYLGSPLLDDALASGDVEQAARMVAESALGQGSDDNATVQILRVEHLADTDFSLTPIDADSLLPVASLAPDQLVDGYRVIRQIHATDRSTVYLAQGETGERVVLKIPPQEVATDPVAQRRFLFEEWVLKRLSSPHIVRAAATHQPKSLCYVAMEYVEGKTLRQWMLDNPKVDLQQARVIAAQIIQGLRALHRAEMLHQDLRPENVMIDVNGTVKLIDLGSVTVAGIEEAAAGTLGFMPGTLQYTAPEYLSGDLVSWRADQYALGVIVYEMLTGNLPYGTTVAHVRSPRDQQRLSYRPAGNGVLPWIDHALATAVHKDPLRRYDALSAFLADLHQPAKGFVPLSKRPLADRHPVRFWQTVSALLGLLVVLQWALLC